MNLSSQELSQIETLLDRKPTLVETYIFDTMWSEHCSYKSTKDTLKEFLPTKGSEVALGIGEDSGIIRFTKHNGKQYCIAISHESHNHPSQILPVEGAATGVGGVVRDVYCMGADVIGVLNSLHFGINKDNQSPLVDEIAENVVLGVSDYANPLGVPVLGGETLYHPSYNDNCLVNVAALGLLDEAKIIHSFVPKEAEHEPYDVILIGKSTDATGFGGASFSSATLDKNDQATNIGAVQVHDPFLKRVIVEALKVLFKTIDDQKISVGFKDLGAGGISCAASEIAVGGGFGVDVNLDHVNVAVDNLLPEVIACSETQERFCLVVPETFTQTVLDIFNIQFEMPKLYLKAGASVIGKVTKAQQFILRHKGEIVCNLPVTSITTEVKAERHATERTIPKKTTDVFPEISLENIQEVGSKILSNPNNKSKRPIYRFFDNAVRGDSILYPGETDAVVVTPIEGCNTGLAVSIDSNLYGHHDPYVSGAAAVAESIRNVISVGARPIAVTDCLNYGNPQKPDVFFDFREGVKGIADACNSLGFIPNEPIPIISGNVSLYNESKTGSAVIPSPVIVVVGRIEDYRNVCLMQLQKENQHLFLIGKRYAEFGGTQISTILNQPFPVAPQVRFDEEATQNQLIHALITEKNLTACHDISAGGLWVTITEMLLGERGRTRVGAELTLTDSLVTTLFSENGGYVIAVNADKKETVIQALKKSGVTYQEIGKTISEKTLTINSVSIPLDTLNHHREN